MGRAKRTLPRRLPEKLQSIRAKVGCTLDEMATKLELKVKELEFKEIKIYSGNIYEYEKGTREPLLPVLLAYALISNNSLDNLIDDRLDLSI